MLPVKILLTLIGIGIGGILLLIRQVKHRRKVESCVEELAKIINGNIKRKKIYLFCEFLITGKYKEREISCNTFVGEYDFFVWLEINTKLRNTRTIKTPFFTLKLSSKKIAQNISVNIFSGILTYRVSFGSIYKPYREYLIKFLDELVTKANEIETQDWERIIS